MAIEVRQMRIKSTVLQENSGEEKPRRLPFDEEEMKTDILAECRRLIIDMLREKKER